MQLRCLIDILEELEEDVGPEAEVHLLSQPAWPFEYSISKVVIRKEFDDDDDEDCHLNNGTSPTDVFLLEGTQLRYGSKKAWNR
jgi:hypothetical protein